MYLWQNIIFLFLSKIGIILWWWFLKHKHLQNRVFWLTSIGAFYLKNLVSIPQKVSYTTGDHNSDNKNTVGPQSFFVRKG